MNLVIFAGIGLWVISLGVYLVIISTLFLLRPTLTEKKKE